MLFFEITAGALQHNATSLRGYEAICGSHAWVLELWKPLTFFDHAESTVLRLLRLLARTALAGPLQGRPWRGLCKGSLPVHCKAMRRLCEDTKQSVGRMVG